MEENPGKLPDRNTRTANGDVVTNPTKPTYCKKEILGILKTEVEEQELSDRDRILFNVAKQKLLRNPRKIVGGEVTFFFEKRDCIIQIGNGDQNICVFYETDGSVCVTSVNEEVCFESEEDHLSSEDVKKAREKLFLSKKQEKVMLFAEEAIAKRNGILPLRDGKYIIEFDEGTSVKITHNKGGQLVKVLTNSDGNLEIIYEHLYGFTFMQYGLRSYCIPKVFAYILRQLGIIIDALINRLTTGITLPQRPIRT